MKRSAFQQLKDAALEQALLLFLRPRFQRYGEIVKLSLDTSRRTLTAEILLLGETVPFLLHEAHYRTEQVGGETQVIFFNVKVSREWAQRLLEDRFKEVRITLPPLLRGLLQ